jgi:PAS domain S-box-containing protein
MACNVLLVEDDPLSRRNLTIYLQQSAHNVIQTDTGHAAVELMSQVDFDVVISDLRLPGRINGMDVLRHHSQMHPGKRLILLTAFGSDEIRAQAEAVGALYYEKPISMDKLLVSVETPTLVPAFGQSASTKAPMENSHPELQTEVTDREIVIEKLKQSEERFRLLVEGVRDYAIYMLDPTGIIITWNAGAERIKGYSAREIIGKHFSCFYRPQDRLAGRPWRALDVAAREGQYEEEHLRVRKDGSEFWSSVLITALRDSAGKLYGFTKVVRDITERKETEERLRQSERLATLGTTAAVFAHEIGNPLNGLSTSLQLAETLLKTSNTPDPRILETLQAASQEVHRLTSLLKDYRSFARPLRLKIEATDLRRAVQEILTPNMRSYTDSGIKVNVQFGEDFPLIHVDKERIKQVILNLCKNAVEAMPDGGELTFKANRLNDQVILEISDTGSGIPDGFDVFQLFKTTKPDGTGLGLPIVQQIVSEHRGTTECVSEPGKGAIFRISIPIQPSAREDL